MKKVTITDNSLLDSDFVLDVKPELVTAYMNALHEFGVVYVEMSTDSFLMLPPSSDMSKVILHMTSQRDLLYVNAFDFAYVVVPADMAMLIPRIERPVILEIWLHGEDYLRAVELFEKNFDLDNVAMIRLVDDFRETPQEMIQLVKNYHDKFIRPLDICPTNKYTNAVSEVISAVVAKTDSITMRFGECDSYAELQDYTVSLATMFGVAPSPQMLAALYKCSCIYAMIYGRSARSMLGELRYNQIWPHMIKNADRPKYSMPNERTTQTSYIRPPELPSDDEDLLYKKLRSMMLDPETAKELEEIIDEFCTKLCDGSDDKNGNMKN